MSHVLVTSAIELSSAQLEKIKKAVAKKYGAKAEVMTKVDATLIGGVTITVDSHQIDGSVRNKIDQMKSAVQKKLLS